MTGKGIRYISGLFDESGNLFEFDMLKNRYGLRGTFLDYQSVIRKIPKNWMTVVSNNKILCISVDSMLNVIYMYKRL